MIAAAFTLSCGENEFTQPNPVTAVVSVGGYEAFYNSAQQETRELLIDGRATDIEWNITGNPSIILLQGDGRAASYYVSVRSLWTTDQFNRLEGIYFLLQWPDLSENRLERPLYTRADVKDDVTGDTLIDCTVSDALIQEFNWYRGDQREDQVTIEIFSDSLGNYPADLWRWGAETTDGCTPVNAAEYPGAPTDGDTLGATTHPSAAFMEDLYDNGGGPVRDQGNWTYMLDNHLPGSNVPLRIASKNPRESRLNRGHPLWYVLWETVSKEFDRCEIDNPIRIDDPSMKDKTWNPGDYVPSFRTSFPTGSQRDVIARGAWTTGKWALELRRNLVTVIPGTTPPTPRADDVQFTPGRRYMMRITIVNGATGARSQSGLLPLYLRPRT